MAFVELLFTAWFIATVLIQFPNPIGRLLAKKDIFAVIPTWTFFAPNPANVDFHLVMRYRTQGGVTTPFRELYTCAPTRSLLTLIWNPERRYTKAAHDLTSELGTAAATFANNEIQLSAAYLTLASFIGSSPVVETATEYQFAIVVGYGYTMTKPPNLLFISEFHRL